MRRVIWLQIPTTVGCEWVKDSVPSVHEVSEIRQTEIHTAESLIPDPWAFEFALLKG
jgi:hypothetical protein